MKKFIYIFLVGTLSFTACEDYLKQEPVDIITDDQVIIDAASAEAAILGVYSRMQTAGMFGNQLITDPGVLSDELTHSGSFPSIAEMDDNNVTAANATIDDVWQQAYTTIFQANNIIELLEGGETDIPDLSEEDKNYIIGEARFCRALAHFQLTNLWGDVPLVTTTDLAANSSISRTAASQVRQFVITEAAEAATVLQGVSYGDDNADGQFRATEWAAKALQARALLYDGQVTQAGTVANDIIENGPFELASSYSSLFGGGPIKNDEIIFGFFYSALDQNGLPFQFLPSGRFEFAVSPQLLAAYSANGPDETRDLVAVNESDGAGRYYVNKYKDIATGTDGVIVFRLAEMYLIRAEANAGTASALADINTLRSRAGATPATSASLDDILNERFVELAFEGHRWYDLRRTNNLVSVMSNINSDVTANDGLLPVPQRDIQQNPNLLPQNSGY